MLIVVDTSALIAVTLAEPQAQQIATSLAQASDAVMSAGTLQEVLIVAEMRGIRAPVERLLSTIRIAPLTERDAIAAAAAYAAWGKGRHPAGLNMGDCFAYVLAKNLQAPLLYVGEDFAKTDIASAI
ncbi:type II toxin-antitoxin system VapC family toxin [Paracoccus ravus]|uniref:type II toxin-antitoxin system VapC family toxin n=1 Tax=Paracoccus ravus TaxID=2447760 RepID=UPI001ADB6D22|nr:type II toxin-antitoxin system VapC family toxin [Paracoccus ravus]